MPDQQKHHPADQQRSYSGGNKSDADMNRGGNKSDKDRNKGEAGRDQRGSHEQNR